MPTFTKEQWKVIELRLCSMFGCVRLKADGYNLTLEVRRYKALRSCIVVFVDGVAKGEWFKGEAPEARKFCREHVHWLYPAKKREEARAALKRRNLSPEIKDLYKSMAEKSFSYWEPFWLSPASLIRHLRKTCTDVELVE